jgi:hypothetical protein
MFASATWFSAFVALTVTVTSPIVFVSTMTAFVVATLTVFVVATLTVFVVTTLTVLVVATLTVLVVATLTVFVVTTVIVFVAATVTLFVVATVTVLFVLTVTVLFVVTVSVVFVISVSVLFVITVSVLFVITVTRLVDAPGNFGAAVNRNTASCELVITVTEVMTTFDIGTYYSHPGCQRIRTDWRRHDLRQHTEPARQLPENGLLEIQVLRRPGIRVVDGRDPRIRNEELRVVGIVPVPGAPFAMRQLPEPVISQRRHDTHHQRLTPDSWLAFVRRPARLRHETLDHPLEQEPVVDNCCSPT